MMSARNYAIIYPHIVGASWIPKKLSLKNALAWDRSPGKGHIMYVPKDYVNSGW